MRKKHCGACAHRSESKRTIYPIKLRQHVSRGHGGVQAAVWIRANCGAAVGATGGASRNTAGGIELDIRSQIARVCDGRAGSLMLFERELIGRGVNLTKVIDTSIGLRGGTGFYKVGNRDSRQEADNCHDNHNFNERKARLPGILHLFHF